MAQNSDPHSPRKEMRLRIQAPNNNNPSCLWEFQTQSLPALPLLCLDWDSSMPGTSSISLILFFFFFFVYNQFLMHIYKYATFHVQVQWRLVKDRSHLQGDWGFPKAFSPFSSSSLPLSHILHLQGARGLSTSIFQCHI